MSKNSIPTGAVPSGTSPELNTYTYIDNSDNAKASGPNMRPIPDPLAGKVVFTIQTTDILLADAAFDKFTGKDVRKMPWIGCRITFG